MMEPITTQMVLVGNQNYLLTVFSDLNNVITDLTKITFTISSYDVNGDPVVVTSFNDYSASTVNYDVNKGKTIHQLLSAVTLDKINKLGISLYKQTTTLVRNLETGISEQVYSYTEISSNYINNPKDPQFLYVNNIDGVITLQLLQNPNNNINLRTKIDSFESGSVYQVKINLGKLFDTEVDTSGLIPVGAKDTALNLFIKNLPLGSGEKGVEVDTNREKVGAGSWNVLSYLPNNGFTFATTTPITVQEGYNKYPLNISTSLDNTQNLMGFDFLFHDNGMNYSFGDINVDIVTLMKKMFIKQYMYEYVGYFESIDKDAIVSQASIDALKTLMLSHSDLINASNKGNIKGMSSVMGVFCQAVGKHLVGFERSPTLQNFVYRVTSSLPKEFWDGDIKNIIHPYSWQDEYVYVEIDSSAMNLFLERTKKHIITNRSFINNYIEFYSIQKFNRARYITEGNGVDIAVDDTKSTYKLDIKPSPYICKYFNINTVDVPATLDPPNDGYTSTLVTCASGHTSYQFRFFLNGSPYYISSIGTIPNIAIPLPYSNYPYTVAVRFDGSFLTEYVFII
jgi:hypothetical protein